MTWFALTAILFAWPPVGAAEGLTVVEIAVPESLEAGSETSIPIVVTNDGSVSWLPADGFAISYHWLDTAGGTVVWDGIRTPLPDIVVPGASLELLASVEAPRRPGDYLLRWDVVQEGVRWLWQRTMPRLKSRLQSRSSPGEHSRFSKEPPRG